MTESFLGLDGTYTSYLDFKDLIRPVKVIIIFLFEPPYNGVIVFEYLKKFTIHYFDCFGQKLSIHTKKRINRLSFTIFGQIVKI
jgi:hypothetical protein